MLWSVRHFAYRFRQLAEEPRHYPIDPRSVPTYAVMALAWGAVTVTFLLTELTYDGSLSRPALALAILMVGAMALRFLSLPRVAGCIEGSALHFLTSLAAGLGSALLATTARPLVDAELIRWDALLGFDWLALMDWLSTAPLLGRALDEAYVTLLWQPWLLVLALFVAGKDLRAWTFLLAWAIALGMTMAIFPFLPAVGPIVHYGISLPGLPLRDGHMEVLEGLRNGMLRELGASSVRGMVTIPSFHVAGAVLLGWGFAGLRYFKWPFIVLNFFMVLSAIPIGGHYLVDVIAGVVIAVVGIHLAKLVLASPMFRTQVKLRHKRQHQVSAA